MELPTKSTRWRREEEADRLWTGSEVEEGSRPPSSTSASLLSSSPSPARHHPNGPGTSHVDVAATTSLPIVSRAAEYARVALQAGDEEFCDLRRADSAAQELLLGGCRWAWNPPWTDFPIGLPRHRDQAAVPLAKPPEQQQQQQEDGEGDDQGEDKELFIMHDCPLPEEEDLSLGQALNKILKDALCKYKRMCGHRVSFRIGLEGPASISQVSDDNSDDGNDAASATRSDPPTIAGRHLQTMHRLGVSTTALDDVTHMGSPHNQARSLSVLARLTEAGYLRRLRRPVVWCPACRTALGHAEVEHKTVDTPSCFVLFPVTSASQVSAVQRLFGLSDQCSARELGLLVWTTSPWSLPLNQAVAVHPDLDYALVTTTPTDVAFVVSSESAPKVVQALAGRASPVVATVAERQVKGRTLQECLARVGQPLRPHVQVPLVCHDRVGPKQGTALLHVAPSCCEEDYEVGAQHGLETVCTFDAAGRYLTDIQPTELAGLDIKRAGEWVMRALQESGRLVLEMPPIKHAAPNCGRCQGTLICRPVQQWYLDLDHDGLFDRVVGQVKEDHSLTFVPPQSRGQFAATLAARPRLWSLSRQHRNGTPIPAIVCRDCGAGWSSPALIDHVAQQLRGHATKMDRVSDLLARGGVVTQAELEAVCGCQRSEPGRLVLELEEDVLDDLFVSAAVACAAAPQGGVCCEGQDQQRGWLQAFVFCSMALRGRMPASTFVTHGLCLSPVRGAPPPPAGEAKARIVDGESADPNHYHGDILRLWALSSKVLGSNVMMSRDTYNNLRKRYTLIRSAAWFMLANLHDFDPSTTENVDELLPEELERFALRTLREVSEQVRRAFEALDTALACKLLSEYMERDLLAFYLQARRPVLYFEKPESGRRRAVQSVLWAVLADLARLWAPVLCFFAEEVWRELVKKMSGQGSPCMIDSSVHGSRFGAPRPELLSDAANERWQGMCRLRRLVVDAVEKERELQRAKLRKPASSCEPGFMQRSWHAQVDVTLPFPPMVSTEAGDEEQPRRGSGEADCRAVHDLLHDLAQPRRNDDEGGEEARGVVFVDDDGLEGCPPPSFLLCDYFGVSRVAIRFVARKNASEVDAPVVGKGGKQSKAGPGARKPAKPKKKGSAPLKELAFICVSTPATRGPCSRCDRRAVQLQQHNSLPRPLLCNRCIAHCGVDDF